MKYLQRTIGLPLMLSINYKARNIKWYIDTSFAVHKDTKSHLGAFMTMGRIAAFAKSIQKNSTLIVLLRSD